MLPVGNAHPPVRSRVLRLLREHGALSRGELAGRLEVPRSQLRAELGALLAAGLVRGLGPELAPNDQRPVSVELHPNLRFAAVNLEATSIDVEIIDGCLEPVAAHAEPVDVRLGPKLILSRLREILAKLNVDGAYQRLYAIGVGMPASVSFRDGSPIRPPMMPGWDCYPVRDVLSREHACPVVVDNDANVMAIGERHSGVAQSVDNFLFVKLGTAIGCGIVLNGVLYRGSDGCAGDIGHISADSHGPVCACGNVGCLEAMFAGSAVIRSAATAARAGISPALAARLARARSLTARDIAETAAEGDPTCVELVRAGSRGLGTVLAGLVNVINPSMIVIGGSPAGLGHLLLTEIRSVVYRRSLPAAANNLPIVRSELGPRAGLVGAAVLASELAFGLQC
jgi:glucokinase-like ROK family protein